ncbi:sensor histidine kinase [Kitasatospora sp. NPDC051853]|uniref:sensor histidine kinase n=1 Tax=Kitasatospora sp. NPDC051853 TaxID=3364058 RepID=UPI0037A23028
MRSLWTRAARSPHLPDLGTALLVQALVAIPFLTPGRADLSLLGLLLTSSAVWALVWRRRWPFAVLLFVGVVGTAAVLYKRPGQPFPYAAFVAMYSAFAHGERHRRLVLTGIAVAAVPVVLLVEALKRHEVQDATFYLMSFVAAAAAGTAARVRRERLRRVEAERDLEAARARAESERAEAEARRATAEAQRAAAEERARIAREMHDVLAHAVVLMTVQAEAGPLMVEHAPPRAVAAFEAIADAGRDATVQLQRILAALGTEEDAPAPRAPQPTLAELPALVDGVRRTGLAVSYEVTGTPRQPPPDVQIAVYRTVQEGLTNAVRHARAASATVRLHWQEHELTVTVTDDGPGPSPSPPASGRPGGGRGLAGLRQRAVSCGGTAAAGPRPDGAPGFELGLRLPLPLPLPLPSAAPPSAAPSSTGDPR